MDPIRVLFVEDLPEDADLAEIELRKGGIDLTSTRVDTEEKLLKALQDFSTDLVLCDYSMPRFTGMEALKIIQKHDPNIPVIMFTGSQNEEVAVECMKAGATDYILKDNITRLPFAVKEALEKKELRQTREAAAGEEEKRLAELEKLNAELVAARNASLNIMEDLNAEIEERKVSEIRLRNSEEKFRELVENLNDVVYSISIDGTITYVSPACQQAFGYTPAELIGTHFSQLYIPDDMEQIYQAFENILRGEILPGEYRMLAKNGEVKWVRTSSRVIKEGEEIRGLQGVLTDITERKLAEQALIQKMDELERFNDLTIGREFTMIGLKKEVNALLQKLNGPEKYKIVE
ncbi:MAG: PAS domain S-box protein [Bacteroidetes bacterium]|nr:MAG: PAS domain S-box protein [Bacteroidota bacterium]